jgi:hypothetical protein
MALLVVLGIVQPTTTTWMARIAKEATTTRISVLLVKALS